MRFIFEYYGAAGSSKSPGIIIFFFHNKIGPDDSRNDEREEG